MFKSNHQTSLGAKQRRALSLLCILIVLTNMQQRILSQFEARHAASPWQSFQSQVDHAGSNVDKVSWSWLGWASIESAFWESSEMSSLEPGSLSSCWDSRPLASEVRTFSFFRSAEPCAIFTPEIVARKRMGFIYRVQCLNFKEQEQYFLNCIRGHPKSVKTKQVIFLL